MSWLVDVRPDPKPEKRHRASRAEWVRLRQEKLRRCRVCREPRTTLHHLVGKDLGGDDVADNLVPLCGSGTTGCHGLVEMLDRKACQTLRSTLTSRELAYVIGKKSEYWLDRRYPRPDGVEDLSPNKEMDQSAGSSFRQVSQP